MCCTHSGADPLMKSHHRRLAVLEAPSNLGLKPPAPGREPGVRYMPAALKERGLLTRLRAQDAGEIHPLAYREAVDTETGIRNAPTLREYSMKLATRIGQLLDTGVFPVVVGGDCSILLGSALALHRRGRFGLLFVDGHTDLLTPQSSATSGAAGMDLALVTGEGPTPLTAIDDAIPYIQPADVVLFGYRFPEPGTQSPANPRAAMSAYPLETIHRDGASHAAKQAVASFAHRNFWLHIDFDVLDPKWMPAVDSPDPGGMNPSELSTLLRAALASENCVGMELTIYDPTLDRSGHGAALIVDLLADALGH
jgi:arginase